MSGQQECAELLRAPRVERAAYAKAFEEASPAERCRILYALDARAQAKLWEASAGSRVSIDEMVPPEREPLAGVRFLGKNSLPAFTHFEKRFCRASRQLGSGGAAILYGYNHLPTRGLGAVVGPGYFVAHDCAPGEPAPGSVAIDYRRIPDERPPGWPELRDNRARLSRFVYAGMVDYLRRVSAHLLIGRATRGGRELPNYFALLRDERGTAR